LTQVRLGSLLIAGVPGEPTSLASFQIESAIRDVSDADRVLVVGYAGDYGGYFTTEAEYGTQHYEGASTLYGRYVTNYLSAWHRHLAESGTPAAPTAGPVTFVPGRRRDDFRAESRCPAIEEKDIEPRVRRKGPRVDVSWRMVRGSRVVFAEGWFIRIEERVGHNWIPLTHLGRDYDDQQHVFHVRQVSSSLDWNPFLPRDRWKASVYLPREIWDEPPDLRVAVAPRDQFPGFTAAVRGR
jgi:hypothetical protein